MVKLLDGPIYCYMVILLMDQYIVIWLYSYGPIYCYMVIFLVDLCIVICIILLLGLYNVIWLYCCWTYILLYGYIVGGPIYCYMVEYC